MKKNKFVSKSFRFMLLATFLFAFLAIAINAQVEDHHYFFEGSPADNGTDDDALTEVNGLVYGTGQIGQGAVCNASISSRLTGSGWTVESPDDYTITFWANYVNAEPSSRQTIYINRDTGAADVFSITKGVNSADLDFIAEDNTNNVSVDMTGFSGVFHHFAIVYEALEFSTLYIDGNFSANSTDVLGSPLGNLAATPFFCTDNSGNNPTNATIDDLRIFTNDALSAVNISNIYCQGNGTHAALNDITGCLPFVDTVNPTFNTSSISDFAPLINVVVVLGQTVLDETELATARFFHNQTGTFVNQSIQLITGLEFNVTHNLTITAPHETIGFGVHVTDATGNTNISTLSTLSVANTAPETPTILFPTADLLINQQPLDFNVTFNQDADGDAITIFYYIDGVLNQTSSFNTTFNATDALYRLNVSLSDSFGFFSPNATVVFTLDSTLPIIAVTSPVADQVINKLTSNVTVDISCVDLNITSLNYTMFNTTTTVKIFGNNTNINIDTLTIDDIIDLTNVGVGSYSFNATCFNQINVDSTQFTINVSSVIPTVPLTETEQFQSTFSAAIATMAVLMIFIAVFVGIALTLKARFGRK